jgi:hypothetical protein
MQQCHNNIFFVIYFVFVLLYAKIANIKAKDNLCRLYLLQAAHGAEKAAMQKSFARI